MNQVAIIIGVSCLMAGVAAGQSASKEVTTPAPGSPEATVQRALQAAVAGDLAAYLATVEPELRPEAAEGWTAFRARAGTYVRSKSSAAFVVVQAERVGSRFIELHLQDLKTERIAGFVRLVSTPSGWLVTRNRL